MIIGVIINEQFFKTNDITTSFMIFLVLDVLVVAIFIKYYKDFEENHKKYK